MAWYRSGTVAVTNGSPNVVGNLTAWLAVAKADDPFRGPDGNLYEIAAVVSNTQITLASNYEGPTATGAAYAIIPVGPSRSLTSELSRDVGQLIADLRTGYTLTSSTPQAIGTGPTTFSVQPGVPVLPGAVMTITSRADPSNFMGGPITDYSGTSMTIDVITTGGSGTYSDWNFNISGSVGPQGPQGDTGSQGIQGIPGTAATVAIASVTTGDPGSLADVSNVGTPTAALLDFTIPRGDTGATGPTGPAPWLAPVPWSPGLVCVSGPPATAVTVTVGDVITTYVCITAHTAGASFDASKFTKIAEGSSASLAPSGVVAGTYGGSLAVPVVTVASTGVVTGVTTASIPDPVAMAIVFGA